MLISNFVSALISFFIPLLLCTVDLILKNVFFTNISYLLASWAIATLIHKTSPLHLMSLLLLLACQLTLTTLATDKCIFVIATQISILIFGYCSKKNFTQQKLFPYFLAMICYLTYSENYTLAAILPPEHAVYGFTFFIIKLILNFYCLSLFLKYTSRAKQGNRL